MDIISIVIILAVFVALLFALYRLGSKHVKFSRRVFIALALGIVFGAAIQLLFAPDSTITLTAIDWINIVGNGYVRFLQMLIMPLIFVSIVGAFTRIEETKEPGQNQRIRSWNFAGHNRHRGSDWVGIGHSLQS